MERPAHIPPDEEWFWTPEWQEMIFSDVEEFLAHLDNTLQNPTEWVRRPRPQVKD